MMKLWKRYVGRDRGGRIGSDCGKEIANDAEKDTAPYSTEVFLVRHAERVDEIRGDEQVQWLETTAKERRFDPPLTKHGLQQSSEAASKLAAYFAERGREEAKASPICLNDSEEKAQTAPTLKPFDVIFCSPLLRCVQTAAAYSCTFGIPITLVPGLGEACAALDTRNPKSEERWNHLRDLEELKQLCPTATFRSNSDATKLGEVFIGKGGATCLGRLARLSGAQNPSRKRILVVSHRESIRHMVRLAQQLHPHQPVSTPYVCMAMFKCKTEGQEKWNFQGFVAEPKQKTSRFKGPQLDFDPHSGELPPQAV